MFLSGHVIQLVSPHQLTISWTWGKRFPNEFGKCFSLQAYPSVVLFYNVHFSTLFSAESVCPPHLIILSSAISACIILISHSVSYLSGIVLFKLMVVNNWSYYFAIDQTKQNIFYLIVPIGSIDHKEQNTSLQHCPWHHSRPDAL